MTAPHDPKTFSRSGRSGKAAEITQCVLPLLPLLKTKTCSNAAGEAGGRGWGEGWCSASVGEDISTIDRDTAGRIASPSVFPSHFYLYVTSLSFTHDDLAMC